MQIPLPTETGAQDEADEASEDEERTTSLSFASVENGAKQTRQFFVDKLPSRTAFLLGFGSGASLVTVVVVSILLLG